MDDCDIQRVLDAAAERLGVVGAQLAVYQRGQQIEFVTGKRHLELQLPVTRDTLFQIGSTTKVFSAALVNALADSGQLHLDAPVQEYIPGFTLADVGSQTRINLRHLLSMSAGLDNGSYHDYGQGDDALGRYVDELANVPVMFSPGSAFGYSNASTNVAGHAAACRMGRTWEQLLRERIVEPLRMKSFALDVEELLEQPVALGYRQHGGTSTFQRAKLTLNRSMGPSGAMTFCSAGDLLRLARMFLDNGRSADGESVLSETAVNNMQQPQVGLPTRFFADEWCLGPYRKVWGGNLLYGHSGTTASGSSTLLWCPQKQVAVSVVANVAAQGYPLADSIFDELFPRLLSMEKPAAPRAHTVERVATDLQPYVGRFEAFDMSLNFSIAADRLMASGTIWSSEVMECELIPLGDGRFFPTDTVISGNRNWDVAFFGNDGSGRPSHFLNGVFPLRRTA